MTQLNDAVRHVLTLKYLAGMFAHPLTDPNRVKTAELTPANLAAARTSADKSMVLLNDQNHALPLSTSTPSIAVVGPLANDALDQLGPDVPIGYDTTPGDFSTVDKIITVVDGIKAAAPNANVTYAQGCDANCTDTSGFGDAVNAAKSSAVTVVVVGEPASDSGEASSRSDISLPGQQLALVQAIASDRQAVRGRADERPPADDRLAGPERSGAAGVLVSRHRGRRRRRRRPVREGRPRRQAADVVPA